MSGMRMRQEKLNIQFHFPITLKKTPISSDKFLWKYAIISL